MQRCEGVKVEAGCVTGVKSWPSLSSKFFPGNQTHFQLRDLRKGSGGGRRPGSTCPHKYTCLWVFPPSGPCVPEFGTRRGQADRRWWRRQLLQSQRSARP